jgi:4-hydroxy-3-methylbut-2-enyl diphosphate reductase
MSSRPATLVADELRYNDRPPIPCPAAVLLEGDLRRRGISASRGPLDLADSDVELAVTATVPDVDRLAGLGIRAADRPGRDLADDVLRTWLRAARPRTVLLAAPRSFCAGVERAIEIVRRLLLRHDRPIYVRKQIVHNAHVVGELARHGAIFVDELDDVPDGATVVFSAHGVSPAVRAEAERRGMDVVDATCPLVMKVHVEARRFAARGDTVVLIGHAGHEETEGTLGEAPDRMVLVQDVADVRALEPEDPTRISYLTQTTLAVDETVDVVDALRDRFPGLRGPASDDICYATTNRQDAVAAVAAEADLVLVVGSANSSNSVRLVELASRGGTPSQLIECAGDIRPEWLAAAHVIGVTAGASAPPRLVEEVVAAIGGLGRVDVAERETARETVRFALPLAVRS